MILWDFFFQRSVQVLNIAGNNLDSIRDVECLRNLYQLHANDNLLTDMKELAHVVGGMFRLWRLDLMGNPLCHKAKYRDRVIVMAKNLGKKLRMVKFFIGAVKKGWKNWIFCHHFLDRSSILVVYRLSAIYLFI